MKRSSLFLALLLWILSSGSVIAQINDYKVGADDLLRVSVSGYPDMSVDLRVSQSGNIGFPYIGPLAVAGRSTGEIEAALAARLVEAAIVKQPQVSVLVVEYRSQTVGVLGQVNKPGQYSLGGSRKVMELLAEAGGIVNATAGYEATLLKKDGRKVQLDMEALFSGDPEQNPVVEGGDTIYVPKAAQFYVYGEVQRPGVYKLERNMTVSQAISAGGGLTPRGSERRVVVKRRTPEGKETSASIRGSDRLKNEDVLMVKESIF